MRSTLRFSAQLVRSVREDTLNIKQPPDKLTHWAFFRNFRRHMPGAAPFVRRNHGWPVATVDERAHRFAEAVARQFGRFHKYSIGPAAH